LLDNKGKEEEEEEEKEEGIVLPARSPRPQPGSI
jgi:hypothetical protein